MEIMNCDCIGEVHSFGGPATIWFDNAEMLLPELVKTYSNQIQLIYLDPPFGTGSSFTINMGTKKHPLKMTAYCDNLHEDAYLSMLEKILEACHSLLSDDGSLYLHIDYRMSARLRTMMDKIFGTQNFMNEIIWAYKSGGRNTKCYSKKHDTILFYRKSKKVFFDIKAVGIPRGPQKRNHMKRSVDEQGRVYFTIRSNGKTYTYYEDSLIYPSDVWTDIEHLHQRDPERTGFLTQKPEALLERIILASSQPGAIVADFFLGSGTTAAVATRLGRQFIGCDSSPFSIHVQRNRLLKQFSPLSMFDQSEPLSFQFQGSLPALNADLEISIKEVKDKFVVTLQQCTLDGDPCALFYAAIGTMQNQLFHAAHYIQKPNFPLEFCIDSLADSALHLVDTHGRQGFFSISLDK